MHAVMDMLMRERQRAPAVDLMQLAQSCLGYTAIDRALTQDHLDSMILPALEALRDLEQHYGDGFRVLGVETRVQFPGVPSAFGTADLLLGNATHVIMIDYKFGQGVGVKAVYDEGDSLGERLNPQLCFYLAGALHSCKKLFKGNPKMAIAIIQPRANEPLTHTEVTKKDIKWFVEDVQNAVVLALDRDPPLHRTEECRWCPAKVSCPKWTGPMLDLSVMGLLPRTEVVTAGPSPYGDYLAKAKALADLAAEWKKEVDEQLHAYLEDGGSVPGWKLKAKTKLRQWVDSDEVAPKLRVLGFAEDDIWDRKLVTFAKADATAKKLGVKIPDHLRVAPASTETTIARSDDPAPAVNRTLAVDQFRAALAHLKSQEG